MPKQEHSLELANVTKQPFSVEEYANIAFEDKARFLTIYSQMTPADCNEIIKLSNTKHKNIVDLYEGNPEFLLFLFENLTPENIHKLCLQQDKKMQTLLHRLPAKKEHDKVVNLIVRKLPATTLDDIVLIKDRDGNTILHTLTSIKNKAAGEIYNFLIQNLAAETIDKTLLILNNDKKSFLYNLFLNKDFKSANSFELTHKILIKSHIKNKSNDYPDAILQLIDQYLLRSDTHRASYIYTSTFLQISKEIIEAGIAPEFLSKKIPLQAEVAIFELMTLERHPLPKDMTKLLTAIPLENFLRDYKRSTISSSGGTQQYFEIQAILKDLGDSYFWPLLYWEQDPLALSTIFNINHPNTYLILSPRDKIKKDDLTKILEVYRKVISYQLQKSSSIDPRYLSSLEQAFSAIKSSKFATPEFAKFRNEIEIMLAQVTLASHLRELDEYIAKRGKAKHSIFGGSDEDYTVRKEYYDRISPPNIDIQEKIKVLNEAMDDKRLTKGRSHRCLDILKKLKADYETHVSLNLCENKPAENSVVNKP